MTWFVLSLLSVFALATAELTQQHLLNQKVSFTERTSAVLTFFFQALAVIPFILFLGLASQIPLIFTPTVLLRLLAVGVVGSIGMVFYLRSFKVKNISFSTILISSSVVVSTTLGIIFYNEETNPVKFIGILLVLGAIISLNYKNAQLEKNHIFGLFAGLLFGISYTLDKGLVATIHPLLYVFLAFSTVAVCGFLTNPADVINSVKGKKSNAYFPIIISGVGYLIYNLCTYFAYRFGGEVGKVDTINNSQVFLIILFEFFILKHTHGLLRKITTALVAFTGVVLLGLF